MTIDPPNQWSAAFPLAADVRDQGPNHPGIYCIIHTSQEFGIVAVSKAAPLRFALARKLADLRDRALAPNYTLPFSVTYSYRWFSGPIENMEIAANFLSQIYPNARFHVLGKRGRPTGDKRGHSPTYLLRTWSGLTQLNARRLPLSLTMARWPVDPRPIAPARDPALYNYLPYLALSCHLSGIKHPDPRAITHLYLHWLRAVRLVQTYIDGELVDGAQYRSVSRADLPLTLHDLFTKVDLWPAAINARLAPWYGKDPG